jgi:hypothetical protein
LYVSVYSCLFVIILICYFCILSVDADLVMIVKIIANLTTEVEVSRTAKDTTGASVAVADADLGELFDVERDMNKGIWDAFETYELCAKKIHKADLEDIARLVFRTV